MSEQPLTASLKYDVDKAIARLGALGRLLGPALRVAMTSAVQLMVRVVTKEKLLGQYLRRRTGTLIRSEVASQRVNQQGDVIVGSFGTNLDYGIKWEEGFDGYETVPAHTRRRTASQRASFRAAAKRIGLSARIIKASPSLRLGMQMIQVREHKAHRVYVAKHFNRDTLNENIGGAEMRFSKATELLATTGRIPRLSDLGGSR